MIAYFILGLCLLAGVILLARWFVGAEPRRVLTALRWVAAGLGLIIGGYLLWGGRHALAALALPMLFPMLMRYRAIWNRIKAAQGPVPGQTSELETRYLRMTLDHDTGAMTGVVREGAFAGRGLGDLGLEQLVDLWRECRVNDGQSASVLEAYLDRAHGDAWRQAAEQGGAGPGPGGGAMSLDEAYEILGLEPGATKEEIHDAHRRLMQKVHPDLGGSNYLAAKINEAKALLLNE